MSAPALIALAYANAAPAYAATVNQLVEAARNLRSNLYIDVVFVDATDPGSSQEALARVAQVGLREVVAVPLTLGEREYPFNLVAKFNQYAQAAFPHLAVKPTSSLGLYEGYLPLVDQRLRQALQQARATELDALVLAAAGSQDLQVTQQVARMARAWGAHHKLPVVAAFAATTPPSTGEAVRSFRAEGRRHVAVATLFLGPDRQYDSAREIALEAGALTVAHPLGAHPELARLLFAQYAVGAVELVPV